MRVLLDECLPRRLKAHLAGHQVITVPEAGWAGKKNGELLRAASGLVDAFDHDRQQSRLPATPCRVPFAVVVLSARSNRLADVLPLVPQVLVALAAAQAGHVVRVGG
jgi:hypothetical protein